MTGLQRTLSVETKETGVTSSRGLKNLNLCKSLPQVAMQLHGFIQSDDRDRDI